MIIKNKEPIIKIINLSNKSTANALRYVQFVADSDVFHKCSGFYLATFKDGVTVEATKINDGWQFEVDCRR